MDNASGMDRYIGQTLDNGRYEILEVIGRGGMAVVFKARDHLLNRFVALKMLREDMAADAEFRKHFRQEAQAVAKLSHANIVSIYDVSRDPEIDYIVMELIEGVTLKQYMKTKGRLGCRESAHFAAQIAKALAHAHEKGIIHRDIKPQNIMIGMDGRVMVADFGIAALETALGEEGGTAVGSVHYISPEQARGQPPDARSDIYSLGVVLYEMLSGVLPFTGDTPDEVTRRHLATEPVSLHTLSADVPEELENVVNRALMVDIAQRYQSAAEMERDLEAYLGAISASEAEPSDLPPPVPPISRAGEMTRENYLRRHRRSTKISLLTGILLVLVFAVAVLVFLWNYWLKDLLSDPVKIEIDDFEGKYYEDVIQDEDNLTKYNFAVNTVFDADYEEGIIISQSPAAGRRLTLDSNGIDMELTVSSGMPTITVPDVVNIRYTDALTTLATSGFVAETRFEASETVTEDFVISTAPAEGEKIPPGSTVVVTVSAGPTLLTVEVPNFIGMSESEATNRIVLAGLSLGTIQYVSSDVVEPGWVIGQDVPAGTVVNERSKITLTVSKGPEETEPPETPTPRPAPTVRVSASNLGGD